MKKSSIFLIVLTSGMALSSAMANPPTIKIIFDDKNHICLDANNKINFKFTYHYNANSDFQYYSAINDITQSKQSVAVPTPTEQGYSQKYTYQYFTISSAGDCGERDFLYTNPGDCYLKNKIPVEDQNKPFSYLIHLIPEPTPDMPYGDKTYNLHCDVQKY